MPLPCSCCNSPNVAALDADIALGMGLLPLAAKYGLSKSSIARHRTNCAGRDRAVNPRTPPRAPTKTQAARAARAARLRAEQAAPTPVELNGQVSAENVPATTTVQQAQGAPQAAPAVGRAIMAGAAAGGSTEHLRTLGGIITELEALDRIVGEAILDAAQAGRSAPLAALVSARQRGLETAAKLQSLALPAAVAAPPAVRFNIEIVPPEGWSGAASVTIEMGGAQAVEQEDDERLLGLPDVPDFLPPETPDDEPTPLIEGEPPPGVSPRFKLPDFDLPKMFRAP